MIAPGMMPTSVVAEATIQTHSLPRMPVSLAELVMKDLLLKQMPQPLLTIARTVAELILMEIAATGTMETQMVAETMILLHGPQPLLAVHVEVALKFMMPPLQ
jgi:hypothetical protein